MGQQLIMLLLLGCYVFWPIMLCVCQDEPTDQSTEQSIDENQGAKNLMQPPESPRSKRSPPSVTRHLDHKSRIVSALLQYTEGEPRTDEDSSESPALATLRKLRLAPVYERRFAMTDEQHNSSPLAQETTSDGTDALIAAAGRVPRFAVPPSSSPDSSKEEAAPLVASSESPLVQDRFRDATALGAKAEPMDAFPVGASINLICPAIEQLLTCLEQIEAREDEEDENGLDDEMISDEDRDEHDEITLPTSTSTSLSSSPAMPSTDHTESGPQVGVRRLLQIGDDPYADINIEVEPMHDETAPRPQDHSDSPNDDSQQQQMEDRGGPLTLGNSGALLSAESIVHDAVEKPLTGNVWSSVSRLQQDDNEETGSEKKGGGSRLRARLQRLRRRQVRQAKQGSAQSEPGNSTSSSNNGSLGSSSGNNGGQGGRGKNKGKGGGNGGGHLIMRRSALNDAKLCKG